MLDHRDGNQGIPMGQSGKPGEKKKKKKKIGPRSVGVPHLGTQEATRRTAMGTLGLHILVVLQPDGREAGP